MRFFSHFKTTRGTDLISDAWRIAEESGAAEKRCTTVEFRAMTENGMTKGYPHSSWWQWRSELPQFEIQAAVGQLQRLIEREAQLVAR